RLRLAAAIPHAAGCSEPSASIARCVKTAWCARWNAPQPRCRIPIRNDVMSKDGRSTSGGSHLSADKDSRDLDLSLADGCCTEARPRMACLDERAATDESDTRISLWSAATMQARSHKLPG